jgi:hypothetical protein
MKKKLCRGVSKKKKYVWCIKEKKIMSCIKEKKNMLESIKNSADLNIDKM